MNNDYVKEYSILEKENWWFIIRKKIIKGVLQRHIGVSTNVATSRILNVGAAAGESSLLLRSFGTVTSVENDPYFVEHLLERGIDVVNADITSLPFPDNSFDIVCAFDVLEHVENDSLAMVELVRVCKNEGYVCITVPMFKMLWGGHDIVNGHYRRYSPREISELIRSPNLKNLYSSYFNAILFFPLLLFRKTTSFIRSKNRKEANSDFQWFQKSSFLPRAFQFLFNLESYLLPKWSLPFGISFINISKKRVTNKKK